MSKVYIGTSGFMYPHWRGSFYPSDLAQRKWFEYYCQHFSSVELNVSFYRLPQKEAFENWRRRAGPKFVFSVKGSRFITHIKRLKDCEEPLRIFFESLRGLTSREVRPHQEKHVVLWQLPPSLAFDGLRLKNFLDFLPQTFRHAFEFRHASWVNPEVFTILQRRNIVEVTVVFQDWKDWPKTTDYAGLGGGLDGLVKKFPFVYIRFHGNRDLYASEYTENELQDWAGKIKSWLKLDLDVYAYFNNDSLGYAVPNAQRLKEQLKK